MAETLAMKVRELIPTEIGEIIEFRLSQFKAMQSKGNDEWFSELCFCILTANSSAKLGLTIQNEIGPAGFLTLSQDTLELKLSALGHRFSRRRAEFIVVARKHRSIKDIVGRFQDERQAREWLVENILGIGCKEASHFLRNVGFDGIAILDRHVLRTMYEAQLIGETPKSLTKKRYFEIEHVLNRFADKMEMSPSKLDLYLWYMKTGNVLK